MGLINSTPQKFDVLKISPLSTDETASAEPTYALRDLRYGKYQDNYYKVSGYHLYQAHIKPYWLRLRRIFGNYNRPQIESVTYTKACEGCSKCYEKHQFRNLQREEDINTITDNANKRWWSGLIASSVPSPKIGPEQREEMDLASRDNPDCDTWMRIKEAGSIRMVPLCIVDFSSLKWGHVAPC